MFGFVFFFALLLLHFLLFPPFLSSKCNDKVIPQLERHIPVDLVCVSYFVIWWIGCWWWLFWWWWWWWWLWLGYSMLLPLWIAFNYLRTGANPNDVVPLVCPVVLRWKCTFCHLLSRLCHTRVSSDWCVCDCRSLHTKWLNHTRNETKRNKTKRKRKINNCIWYLFFFLCVAFRLPN